MTVPTGASSATVNSTGPDAAVLLDSDEMMTKMRQKMNGGNEFTIAAGSVSRLTILQLSRSDRVGQKSKLLYCNRYFKG